MRIFRKTKGILRLKGKKMRELLGKIKNQFILVMRASAGQSKNIINQQ